ncbi:MAG: hypothetical protein SGI77_02050 [Pirellulaceae bacterium]|nr:hypothetical protein [Pirellulaceae bacterium]
MALEQVDRTFEKTDGVARNAVDGHCPQTSFRSSENTVCREAFGTTNGYSSPDTTILDCFADNAVYEKYLNIFREDPATERGKKLCEERDRLLQLLSQKMKKAEDDYEDLKKTSPVYRVMVEKHLKAQLKQLRGKLKSQSSEEKEDGDK